MSFKPIDSKRDEFRKYLERTGVLEALSKVLVKLYELNDKPENAIDFLRQNIGEKFEEKDKIDTLRYELAEAKVEIAKLKNETSSVKTEIAEDSVKDIPGPSGDDRPILNTPPPVKPDDDDKLEEQPLPEEEEEEPSPTESEKVVTTNEEIEKPVVITTEIEPPTTAAVEIEEIKEKEPETVSPQNTE